MEEPKCTRCLRSDGCNLKTLAMLTLPWVVEAHGADGSDWERAQGVRRALRGSGGSPGYVEDWHLAGAMSRDDIDAIAEAIVTARDVELADLCNLCLHYLGPDFDVERPDRWSLARGGHEVALGDCP